MNTNIENILENNPILKKSYLPSILNVNRDADRTSEKYKETNDPEIVEYLNNKGFFINTYKQTNAHNKEKLQYKPFIASFVNPNLPKIENIGQLSVLFENSKDGVKSAAFNLGFYTFLCSNGLKVGTSLFNSFIIRHKGNITYQIDEFIDNIIDVTPKLYNVVNTFRKIELNPRQALEFAEKASVLRFKDNQKIEPTELLKARRREDNSNSLWHVFSRVQENLIRPNRLINYRDENNKIRLAKPIKNITLDRNINTGLWELANEYIP